uniref:Uncharacterized protein n=1 Tax=Rhizophora mucronata TaxID=61149 RepID=A0A2P2R1W9_RHIMU
MTSTSSCQGVIINDFIENHSLLLDICSGMQLNLFLHRRRYYNH